MKSVPNTLFFKPMKEEPHLIPFCGIGNLIDAGKPPYRPGEKCYVREVWGITGRPDPYADTIYGVQYKSDGAVLYPYYPIESHFDVADWSDIGKWRSPVTMPQWAARSFVTVLSCEPIKVSEVTEEDAIRYGVYQFHSQSKGLEDKPYYRSLYSAQELFRMLWTLKHPDKEWAWRVESEGRNHG